MDNLVGSNIGLVHLIASLVATIAGTIVIGARKGTRFHKQWGYVYAISMLVLNITAFMTYRLFGTFGVFHYGAIGSLLTLYGGMVPAIRRKGNWIDYHIGFMYWSVIGLYAAFASETITRVPMGINFGFFGMVGLATGLIMLLGAIFFIRYRKLWQAQFSKYAKP
ncbi:hypothetical protein BFP97_14455 [Roseivirga sp. 4D4]|uniref:DUF2306 domain-containing protein n=1 Tax=Roseivirga sp. 4D4 TaxID=1889784 RepID=UPI00085306DB|nr:DUF2306 domain-containing protein [Roseivirga sp. 4D4]OEK02649.1 hypothetical protein BFP97_14455 [Roseivirga sp. 4D4]